MSDANSARSQRRRETRELAGNFLDDLNFLAILLQGPTPGRAELRMVSTTLRRIFLQQQELKRVADVRIENFSIMTPDFELFQKQDWGELLFFSANGGNAFGVQMSIVMAQVDPLASPRKSDFSPESLYPFTIREFLSQKTIFWRDTWFKRRELIEFAANKLGGAHTGKISSRKEKILKDLCAHSFISIVDGVPTLSFTHPTTQLKSENMSVGSKRIDFVLFDVFSAVHYLVRSPDTKRLISIIEAEFSSP